LLARKFIVFCVILVFLLLIPATANALTREDVLDRANSWIEKEIMYSQSQWYENYRQDCSGFVSMCLILDTSYTTRSIDSVLTEISFSELNPGDVLWKQGHVALFVKWEDNENILIAHTNATGTPAHYDIVRASSYSKAYTLPGITTRYQEQQAKIEAAKQELQKTLNELMFNFQFFKASSISDLKENNEG